MPETPRTDEVHRRRLARTHAGEEAARAQWLIAEMLERIAIALEKEAKE